MHLSLHGALVEPPTSAQCSPLRHILQCRGRFPGSHLLPPANPSLRRRQDSVTEWARTISHTVIIRSRISQPAPGGPSTF
jgi:hypothetical protein